MRVAVTKVMLMAFIYIQVLSPSLFAQAVENFESELTPDLLRIEQSSFTNNSRLLIQNNKILIQTAAFSPVNLPHLAINVMDTDAIGMGFVRNISGTDTLQFHFLPEFDSVLGKQNKLHLSSSIGKVLTLTGEGYVGVGNTAPSAVLDIGGSLVVDDVIRGKIRANTGYVWWFNKTSDVPPEPEFYVGVNAYSNEFGGDDTAIAWSTPVSSHMYNWNWGDAATGFMYTATANSEVIKQFVIDHPIESDKYLTHVAVEGPEAAVYYRGSSALIKGKVTVELPDYFEALTRDENRSISVTTKDGFDVLSVSQIKNGRFSVNSNSKSSTQAFDWEVKAERKNGSGFNVEPKKDEVLVRGMGPYTFILPLTRDKQ